MNWWTDPVRRRRLRFALFYSVVLSVIGGGLGFLSELIPPIGRPWPGVNGIVQNGIITGLNAMAVMFWISFGLQFLYEITKSHAVLEFERRCRYAEERFKRCRQ